MKVGVLFFFTAVTMSLMATSALGQEKHDNWLTVSFETVVTGLFRFDSDDHIEAADRQYVLASRAYRSGSYLKAGLLFIDAVETYQGIRISQEDRHRLFWGVKDIYPGLSRAFVMAGHPDLALEFLKLLPESKESIQFLEQATRISSEHIGLYSFDKDNPCYIVNAPFNWDLWLSFRRYAIHGITSEKYAEAFSLLDDKRTCFEAGVSFLQAAGDFNVFDGAWARTNSSARASSYYCSAFSFLRAERNNEGVERLCRQVWLEPSPEATAVLVYGIQLLSGRHGVDVREICSIPVHAEPSRIPIGIDRRWVNCDKVGLQFAAECEVDSAVVDWQREGQYGAMGAVALAMATIILVSPEDERWTDLNYYISDQSRTEKDEHAYQWLEIAAKAFLMSGGAFHAKTEMERINKSVPALFDLLKPGYFYILDATYIDPHRTLLRQGMDIEALSLSKHAPVLFDRKQNHRLKPYFGAANTSKSEESFRKAEVEYGKKNYAEAASKFFDAAVVFDVDCDKDLCRDGLWLWRAHAVWNAVTSLRQLKDPAKACEEAKKFVVLAGDGHQKSAAADVEDALCSGLPN